MYFSPYLELSRPYLLLAMFVLIGTSCSVPVCMSALSGLRCTDRMNFSEKLIWTNLGTNRSYWIWKWKVIWIPLMLKRNDFNDEQILDHMSAAFSFRSMTCFRNSVSCLYLWFIFTKQMNINQFPFSFYDFSNIESLLPRHWIGWHLRNEQHFVRQESEPFAGASAPPFPAEDPPPYEEAMRRGTCSVILLLLMAVYISIRYL